jgi:small subunit ribosomal protein S17
VNERKTREAVVISDKMQKTRVVRIERVHRHPRYERVVRSSKRLKVHDEANTSRVGDRVVIEETRPLSKEKRWRIRQIVKVADAASNRPPTAQAEQALR